MKILTLPSILNIPSATPPAAPIRLSEVRDDPGSDEDAAEPVKGTSTSLIAVIAVLACVLVVVLIGGLVFYRRSRTNGEFSFGIYCYISRYGRR